MTDRVGLVPTMGALHGGHVSLIRRAQSECSVVVVSVFVNPAQFDDPADLAHYPRDEFEDVAMASAAGADIIFAPAVSEMYPAGMRTHVNVEGMTAFEGAVRGADHFRGVATIVLKLFNTVRPDIAYFGQKDAQQALLVRHMAMDLFFDGRIEIMPTVRDLDGLPLSSRNSRLTSQQRVRATTIPAALRTMSDLAATGETHVADLIHAGRSLLDVDRLDYLDVVNPESFETLITCESAGLGIIGARIGDVRLIDSLLLHVSAASP